MTRSTWTAAERLQVRGTFGAADEAEALELFAPDDWAELQEIVPAGDLEDYLFAERESLRRKAARNRAGAEMGFSPGEIALMGARTLKAEHEDGGAA